MAKILLIEGESIKVIDKVKFTEEGKLQDYLEKYPSLVPLSEIVEGAADFLCIGREVPAGPGWLDLLFIDKDGLLTIVETKLAKNPEARREVIGQVIEYASYISKWTADDVYRIANQYLKSDKVPDKCRNKTLYEVIEQFSPEGSFSVDDFRSNIEQNLKNGRMRLIIAVDELIEALRAMVTFLNSYSNFDIFLLQVSSFEESTSKKILFPSLFGYTPATAERSAQKRYWNEASFFADVKEKCEPKVASTIRKLYDFTKDNADTISWGTGRFTGSFTFRKSEKGVFTVSSGGLMSLNFGELRGKGVQEDSLQSFRMSLNKISGINITEEAIGASKYPSIKAETLSDADNLGKFQDAVLTLCQHIEVIREQT